MHLLRTGETTHTHTMRRQLCVCVSCGEAQAVSGPARDLSVVAVERRQGGTALERPAKYTLQAFRGRPFYMRAKPSRCGMGQAGPAKLFGAGLLRECCPCALAGPPPWMAAAGMDARSSGSARCRCEPPGWRRSFCSRRRSGCCLETANSVGLSAGERAARMCPCWLGGPCGELCRHGWQAISPPWPDWKAAKAGILSAMPHDGAGRSRAAGCGRGWRLDAATQRVAPRGKDRQYLYQSTIDYQRVLGCIG